MDSYTSLSSTSSSGSKKSSVAALNHSLTSSPSSKFSQSNSFWNQFSRQESPAKKKSFWNLLKKKLSLGDKTEKDTKINLNEKIALSTHPEGLYCVIDQFLSTYSDGHEYSDDEENDDDVD